MNCIETQMYPVVEINLDHIRYNASYLKEWCKSFGVEIAVVTKLVCGDENVVRAILDSGIKTIADSRIENFEKMKNVDAIKMLLRIPMLSQIEKVVDLVDVSLVSEIETIRNISKVSFEKGKVHRIILMIDLGDLREGIICDELVYKTVEETIGLKNIELLGIGTNLTCFGGVVPTRNNLSKLVQIKEELEKRFNIEIQVVSGGNSGTLRLLENNLLPEKINHLRLGASIMMGIGLNDERIPGLKYDVFTLGAEIVEIMDKPSVPIGEIGLDAFGNKPFFEDLGFRKKVICAIGKQDVLLEDIVPLNKGIKLLGMSSDHLIIDITESDIEYSLGDLIIFKLSYGGVLRVMTSEYVHKVYTKDRKNYPEF